MLGQILKILRRNIFKHPFVSGLHIIGLSVGLSAFLLIFHYARFETSFDKFHRNSDRIFRVNLTKETSEGLIQKGPRTYPALAQALESNYPGIEAIDKVLYSDRAGGTLMRFQTTDIDVLRDDIRGLHASSGIFEIFDIELIQGEARSFDAPFNVMLSDELAKQIYGDENPVGRLMIEDDGQAYQIVGLFRKWKDNSHLNFEMITSYASIGARHNSDLHETSWDWDRITTYLMLEDGINKQSFETQIRDAVNTHKPQRSGLKLNEFIELQSVKDIRLNSDFAATGNFQTARTRVNILMGIGLIILVMAWINFTNLSLARGLDRIKESGIIKVLGATRGTIIRQHLTESFLVNLLAFALAMSFYQLLLPSLNSFANIPESFGDELALYAAVLGCLLVGSLISGIYPAFLLSRVDIILALKKKISRFGFGARSLRNVLTSLQFAISLSLLIGLTIVFHQLEYLKSIEPGAKIEGVLIVKGPRAFDYDEFFANPDVIKNELNKIAGIEGVSSSYAVPGGRISAYPIRELNKPLSNNVSIHEHTVDHAFIDLYDHELLAGRNFSQEILTDDSAAIINEAAMLALGFNSPEDAIGKQVTSPDNEFIRHIVGVIKDYRQQSAHSPKQPILFGLDKESRGYYSLIFSSTNVGQLLNNVEATFNEVFPENIFKSFFLDDYYNSQFEKEEKLGKLLFAFTATAIVLALMGLVSMTFLSVIRRLKEVNIRKVLGAGVGHLISLMGRSGTLSYAIAACVAVPLTLYFMSKWLQGFNAHVKLGLLHFSAPVLLMYAVAGGAVIIVLLKALSSNPVNILRED